MSVSVPVERPTRLQGVGKALVRVAGNPGLWLALVALGLTVPIITRVFRPAPPALPVLGTLPAFALTDQEGKAFGSQDLRGQVWVAGFIFTRCPTICPAITATMGRMQHRARGLGHDFRLVSFSVDPGYDTPDRLADYASRHRASPRHWKFLTGSFNRVKQTVVDGLKISMADRAPAGEQDFASIMHGTHFVLVDRDGRIRGYYDSSEPEVVDRVLADATMLINRGKLSVAENQSASIRVRSVRGKRMGRYVLLEHLASGGMAEIFLARLEGEGGFAKDLVLKVLQERYADNAQVVKMFLDEARLGAELNHPHIVDVFEIGESDGLRFIAMEYLEGRTLNDVVTRSLEVARPLPRTYAAYVVAQVAEALAYLQAGLPGRGRQTPVVHRDISPPNVIVGYAGGTKLIDFGIARRADARPDEEAGLRPGKVSYMSPEQVRGEPLDGRSDIFSLGTILYEITLGRRLWRGQQAAVMQRIVEETPPPPSYVDRGYPPALERIVMRSLEKRPGDRYGDAAEMMLELDRFLDQGERVTNRHLANHLQALWAEDVVVSAGGVRQARAFDDDEGTPDAEGAALDSPLDFDRPLSGAAGAELAHALRDTHPIDLAMGLGRTSQQAEAPVAPPSGPAAERFPAPPGAPLGWGAANAASGTDMGPSPDRRLAGPESPPAGRASGHSWARILLLAAVLAGVVAGAVVVLLRA